MPGRSFFHQAENSYVQGVAVGAQEQRRAMVQAMVETQRSNAGRQALVIAEIQARVREGLEPAMAQ